MTVYAIGEVLIDFVPRFAGALAAGGAFEAQPGGAPLNVAAAVSRLGGAGAIVSAVGDDAFGRLIHAEAQAAGVDTAHLLTHKSAPTGFAFVTLDDSGERSFSFYREGAADRLFAPTDFAVQPAAGDVLHFCSVSLTAGPMREAHAEAIRRFHAAGAPVSFDLNIRLPLWNDEAELHRAVWDMLPRANIVKLSDDELEFVTRGQGLAALFVGSVQHVIYTKGRAGAEWHTRAGLLADVPAYAVETVDATGAGDAFVGAVLAQLQSGALDWAAPNLSTLTHKQAAEILRFAAAAGALTTTARGALAAIPTLEEVRQLRAERQDNDE